MAFIQARRFDMRPVRIRRLHTNPTAHNRMRFLNSDTRWLQQSNEGGKNFRESLNRLLTSNHGLRHTKEFISCDETYGTEMVQCKDRTFRGCLNNRRKSNPSSTPHPSLQVQARPIRLFLGDTDILFTDSR